MSNQDMSNSRSVAELLSDLSNNITSLFQKELQLFRAETSEKLTHAAVALGSILTGVVLALCALMVLLQAVVIGLTNLGIPAGWSALITGVVVAAIAYVLIHKGTKDLSARNLAPQRTMDALKKDAESLKG